MSLIDNRHTINVTYIHVNLIDDYFLVFNYIYNIDSPSILNDNDLNMFLIYILHNSTFICSLRSKQSSIPKLFAKIQLLVCVSYPLIISLLLLLLLLLIIIILSIVAAPFDNEHDSLWLYNYSLFCIFCSLSSPNIQHIQHIQPINET